MMSGNNPNKNAPQHAAHFFAGLISQENAGPSQVFLTPTGGGLGTAQPWG
jgi:hypothetical protein